MATDQGATAPGYVAKDQDRPADQGWWMSWIPVPEMNG